MRNVSYQEWLKIHYSQTFDWTYDPDFGWLPCCFVYVAELASVKVSAIPFP